MQYNFVFIKNNTLKYQYTLLLFRNPHVCGKMKREEILRWQIWYLNKHEVCAFTLVILEAYGI